MKHKGICCLVAFLLIVAILVAAVITVLNLTPKQLKLDRVPLGSFTLAELGLADTKIIDVFKSISGLAKIDEEKLVANAPEAEKEAPKAKENTTGSNIPTLENGEPDYTVLADAHIIYDKQYLKTYDDTTLAYIFTQMISSEGADSGNEALSYLANLNAECREITITKGVSSATLRIVASIDITSMLGQVQEMLGPLASVIQIPDTFYLVSYQTMDVNLLGRIVTTSVDIKLNDKDDALSNAIFTVLSQGKSDSNEAKTEVNNTIGEGFAQFISNLGYVGTATAAANSEVTGDVVFGLGGVEDGTISVITRVAE